MKILVVSVLLKRTKHIKTTGVALRSIQSNRKILPKIPLIIYQIIQPQVHPDQKSNYELFNCNNFNIRYWSWNYRGCWHQTCPPIAFVKGFKLYSFQLLDVFDTPNIVIFCHYLPVSGVGNLRACCLPWMWQLFLRLPLRNRTLIPRYPLQPW